MRRSLLLAPLLALTLAPSALASQLSGSLSYCTEGDICRYFPDPRLSVTFSADPGERNAPTLRGLTFQDPGSTIAASGRCRSETAHRASCDGSGTGDRMIFIFTGDLADVARPVDPVSYYLGPGDDIGEGTPSSDYFAGGDGHDELSGAAGLDTLTGDAGKDLLDGGSGDDDLNGGSGKDRVLGGKGADVVNGGRGDDRLAGGSGRDLLIGGRGRDFIDAGPGNDRIRGRDGRRDRIRCGGGFDRVTADRFDRVSRCERVRRRH